MTILETMRGLTLNGHGDLSCRPAPETIYMSGRIDATIEAKEANFESSL